MNVLISVSLIVVCDMLFTSQETCLNSLNVSAESLGLHLWTDFTTGVSHDRMSHDRVSHDYMSHDHGYVTHLW